MPKIKCLNWTAAKPAAHTKPKPQSDRLDVRGLRALREFAHQHRLLVFVRRPDGHDPTFDTPEAGEHWFAVKVHGRAGGRDQPARMFASSVADTRALVNMIVEKRAKRREVA